MRCFLMAKIQTIDLNFSYRAKHQTIHAVKDVNLLLEPGLMQVIIGKSGSGKSTLLSLLASLQTPEQGMILVDDMDLQKMDADQYRRKRAAVIFQAYNLFPLLTVQENIIYPLLLNKIPKRTAETQAEKVLEQVGMDASFLKRFPATLSGGEQQRVAIARALANQTDIVLADEPTGNLDAKNTERITGLLSSMAHNQGCCVVVVTHDLSVAANADRVFTMDGGTLSGVTP